MNTEMDTNMNSEMIVPEKITNELLPIKERALALVITTPEEKQIAGQMFIDIGLWEKQVKEYFEPMKQAANRAHKIITAKEKEQLDKSKEVKLILSPKLANYQAEEERLRAQAVLKEIDQYHKNTIKAGIKADELCKQGKDEQAADVLANIKHTEVTIPEPVKVTGLAMVEDYEITITNPDLVPREYCIPDEALIKRDIKNFRGKKQIPGVTFIKTLKPRRTGRGF